MYRAVFCQEKLGMYRARLCEIKIKDLLQMGGVLFRDFPREKCRIEVCWSKKSPKVFLKLDYDNEN